MVATTPPAHEPPKKAPLDPFRRAVLSGLGLLLPPLLTIVIFLWVGNTVARYLLTPLEDATRYMLVEYGSDIRTEGSFPPGDINDQTARDDDGKLFRRTPDGLFIPDSIYESVAARRGSARVLPTTAEGFYGAYVNKTWLQPWLVVPVFLSVFLLLLYVLGKFLAAGIGRFFWNRFELVITRLPLVSNVYSSVKQVTDFIFTDPDLGFTRVVAVEYPRKGVWTVAFVTGDSLLDIESAANESVMTVLIPTSPMPFTGFTITVKKSETVDLNLTMDQAFQFVVSCGVVVPPHQFTMLVRERMEEAAESLPAADAKPSKNGKSALAPPSTPTAQPDTPPPATRPLAQEGVAPLPQPDSDASDDAE
ncbi:hypothetical protein Mal64_17070 [Pseudobythopirellula maris]|uniref:DUF502 domain-containing protein n=1 Tax=Pseudobythopirellula maris TaxID=2527991 RepID=A0A5C5ZLY8_9BACT|nr:DUF502 domain-containing protein [Pseudobythopirellula maris]TWT88228.1 hypothetical protein Mal64_17070 [Pseudobythopirellula maris]